MKFKHLLFCLTATGMLMSGQASAVDGYKSVKFGSTFSQLQSGKICNWKKYDAAQTKGMDTYYCTNLSFAGKSTTGLAIFIDKKFERFSIPLTKDIGLEALIDSLKKKYGEPSSMFTQEEIQKVMSEGGEVSVKFDNNTVMVSITRDNATKEDSSLLVYSSSDYFEKLGKLQSNILEGEL